jgi:preprotein translocase subunit SecD
MIITFLVITAGLYALVLFTPGSTAPKLGIDLQGGTRVTLTARTTDGSTPSQDSMKLARSIMEQRVNGSGVAGAQVQIDGSNQLVITVPGQNNLEGLTRPAKLNIRPLITTAWVNPALTAATSTTGTTPATGTGTGTATAAGTATGSATPTGTSTSPTTTGTNPVIENQTSGTDSTATSGTSAGTTASGQGLRGDHAALAPAEATSGAAPSPSSPASDATSPATTSPTTAPSTAPTTGAAGSSTEAAAGTGTANPTAPVTVAPPASAFPAGSDPNVLTQPKGSSASAISAWETAASAYASTGSGPTCAQIEYYQGLDDPDKPLLACDQQGVYVYLLDKTLIPGTQISDATSGFDTQQGQGWIINVTFKSAGFKTWANYTTEHYDTTGGTNPPAASYTAFTLDSEVLSAPVINEPITTATTTVSGSFTQTSAKSLADSLKFGALPLAFDRQESEQVSAELGFQYLKAGLIAGGIGLALVVLYCLLYYRLLGLITILSLVLSGGLVYAVMVLLGRWIGLSLDMAGIAGLIIAIGITADSFVVYFERIKDEVREGRTFRSSVARGWTRAKRTILSADAVSFLSAAILYLLAVGDVKGFAFTLGLSTVLDLLVVFLVTHPLVALVSGANVFEHPLWSGLGSVARAGREHRTATARLQAKEA